MKVGEIRDEMRAFRERVDAVGQDRKDSYYALDELYRFYDQASCERKLLIEEVIFEWLGAEDEGHRFDAIALINEFGLQKAIPHLQKLAIRLRLSQEPSAPFEIEKINRSLMVFGVQ